MQLKRNARLLASQHEIFSLSDQVIERMVKEVAARIGESVHSKADKAGCLHASCDAVSPGSTKLRQIAVIDLIASFANVSQGTY